MSCFCGCGTICRLTYDIKLATNNSYDSQKHINYLLSYFLCLLSLATDVTKMVPSVWLEDFQ